MSRTLTPRSPSARSSPTATEAIAARFVAVVRPLFALDHDPAGALPVAQLKVCIRLYEGPRTLSALGRELGVSLSAMTQIADRLERARLVKRVRDADRRTRRLRLTQRGQRIMHARETARVTRVAAAFAALTAADRAAVDAALAVLLAANRVAGQRAAEPAAARRAPPIIRHKGA